MSTIIQSRRDTAANWAAANPILAQGEKGYETDSISTEEAKYKIGDGVTSWLVLPYQISGKVKSVNGETGVVVLDTSNIAATTDKNYVTDAEKTVIGNTSGTNTGDETTGTIQSKRPIKTINGNSLEGAGDVEIVLNSSGFFASNILTFENNFGNYFGTKDVPRTGSLTTDLTNAVTGGIDIVYYNNATLDIDITPSFSSGSFIPNEVNMLFLSKDKDGFFTLSVMNVLSTIEKYYFSSSFTNQTYGTLVGVPTWSTGAYIEFKFRSTDNFITKHPIVGNPSSGTTNFSIDTSTTGRLTGGGSGTNYLNLTTVNNVFTVVKLVNNGTIVELYQDGVFIENSAMTAAQAQSTIFNQLFMQWSIGNITAERVLTGDFEYIDFNGDKIEFKTQTNSHASVSGDITLILKSGNGADVTTLFTAI